MLKILKIKIFGQQPIPNISNSLLEKIIKRDYPNHISEVNEKLKSVNSDSSTAVNRIAASILKLANRHFGEIDKYIELSKVDFRDVITKAEYPSALVSGFKEKNKKILRKAYLHDWRNYTKWLTKD